MNKTFLKTMFLSDKFIVKHGRKYGYIEIILGILMVISSGILYLWFDSVILKINSSVQSAIETLQDNHEIMSLGEKSIESIIGLLHVSLEIMFLFIKPFCFIVACMGMSAAYNGLMYLRLKELAESVSDKISEQTDILPSP